MLNHEAGMTQGELVRRSGWRDAVSRVGAAAKVSVFVSRFPFSVLGVLSVMACFRQRASKGRTIHIALGFCIETSGKQDLAIHENDRDFSPFFGRIGSICPPSIACAR